MISAKSRASVPLRHRAASALVAVGLIGGLTAMPLVPAAAHAPESVADLAAGVVDAVVNISASQVIDEKKQSAIPDLPPGTPLDDMFEEFFKHRGQQGDNEPRQRKSNSLGSGFVIDPTGIIITNNHVIEDATEITIIFTDGQKLRAKVL